MSDFAGRPKLEPKVKPFLDLWRWKYEDGRVRGRSKEVNGDLCRSVTIINRSDEKGLAEDRFSVWVLRGPGLKWWQRA